MSDTPRTDKFVRDEVATTCYDDFPGDRAIEEMENLERESDRLAKQCVRNVEEIGTLRAEVRNYKAELTRLLDELVKAKKDAKRLERERDDLNERINTAVNECTQYTPEEWERACHYAEPIAVWLDGKQMTRLMKDAARLDFLDSTGIEYNCGEYEVHFSRDDIDAAMEAFNNE